MQKDTSSPSYQSATIILNPGSGRSQGDAVVAALKEIEAETGLIHDIITINPKESIAKRCEAIVRDAKQKDIPVIAAGGDGTVNLVAALCYRHQVTMGIIPLGTFNYFARDLGISANPIEAVKMLTTHQIRNVAVGLVNDHVFLNNASLGIHARMIRERENHAARFGRIRFIALLSGINCLFEKHKPNTIKLVADGKESVREMAMLFVGNNRLQLDNLGLGSKSCAERDKLAVVFMPPVSRLKTFFLLVHGASKTLRFAPDIQEFCADEFEVQTRKHRIETVIDGELVWLQGPLRFHIDKESLSVLAPVVEV